MVESPWLRVIGVASLPVLCGACGLRRPEGQRMSGMGMPIVSCDETEPNKP
jgi:hypothetical protein